MSSIKLTADSGGGTFELKAPSSGSNARVLTVPDTASGTVLTTTSPKAGNIIQVVQTEKTDAFTSTSTSYVDITGLTANITITGSNKVLVVMSVSTGSTNARFNYFKLIRGSTHIFKGDQVGSHRPSLTFMESVGLYNTGAITTKGITYLDSPGAGTHTYKLQGAVQGGTGELCVNTSSRDSDASDPPNNNDPRTPSSIILMEVAV